MKQLNWYQIFGKSNIPDGRTVLPTDDIQIWLNCANIWDKDYTTLAEVLADTDTLSALINSENAVDYMVRSTTWISGGEVPQMTGYTSPSGEVIFSNEYSWKYLAWYAFDRGAHGQWEPSGSAGNYIGYKFEKKVNLYKFSYQGATGSYTSWSMKDFKLQGSNDNETWTDIQNFTYTSLGNVQTFTLSSLSNAYQYFRLYCINGNGGTDACATEVQFYYAGIAESSTAMTYIGQNNYCANTLLADATWCEAICNSEYFESVLNVKVPTMTSATTPYGEAFGSTAGTYYPWKAFNGTNSSATDMWYAGVPATIGYKFTRTVKVVRADITGRNTDAAHMYSVRNFVIQGSNDDFVSDVNDLGSFVNTDNSPRSFHSYIFANDTEYQSYRLSVSTCNKPSSGDYDTCAIGMLQFYGRKDV